MLRVEIQIIFKYKTLNVEIQIIFQQNVLNVETQIIFQSKTCKIQQSLGDIKVAPEMHQRHSLLKRTEYYFNCLFPLQLATTFGWS